MPGPTQPFRCYLCCLTALRLLRAGTMPVHIVKEMINRSPPEVVLSMNSTTMTRPLHQNVQSKIYILPVSLHCLGRDVCDCNSHAVDGTLGLHRVYTLVANVLPATGQREVYTII